MGALKSQYEGRLLRLDRERRGPPGPDSREEAPDQSSSKVRPRPHTVVLSGAPPSYRRPVRGPALIPSSCQGPRPHTVVLSGALPSYRRPVRGHALIGGNDCFLFPGV